MTPTRREFLERLTGGAALFAALPPATGAAPFAGASFPAALTLREVGGASTTAQGENWDLSWVSRITGAYKAVFDVPEIESGVGVWRASIAMNQYRDVLKAGPRDFSMVLVLRHHAIALAMQQEFWDAYGVGKRKDVTHPLTGQPTDRNPALLSSARGEVSERFGGLGLDRFLARGGIALGCDLAFEECVGLVKAKDKLPDDAARKKAVALLVPGVILQPSGVFACVRAQQAGCVYVRAS